MTGGFFYKALRYRKGNINVKYYEKDKPSKCIIY